MTSHILLSAAVFVPIIGAALLPLITRLTSQKTRDCFALAVGILTLAFSATLIKTLAGSEQPVFLYLPFPPGFDLVLRADALAVFMAVVSSFVSVAILFYSMDYMSHYKENLTEYYTMVVLFLGSMMGLVFTSSLLWMYIFWEVTGFCSWRLVGFFRKETDVLKANKTFLVTLFGALCMLIGILMVYFEFGTFDLTEMTGEPISIIAATFILLGILSKSATLPFSSWLPDAGVAPSTVTSLLHAAVLVKIGVYAYARIFCTTFAVPEVFSTAVLIVAGMSALVSAGAALVDTNIKRIIAYSTISQLAFIFLGLASGNTVAFAGALLYIMMHSVAKGGLFLCAGIVEQNVHTKDIRQMGGLISSMPVTAMSFALCALSVMGIPPFGGFFSKFMVFSGAAQHGNAWILSMFLLGGVMTLLYLIRLFYAVFLGDPAGHNNPREGSKSMTYTVLFLGITGFVLGVLIYYPSSYATMIATVLGVNLQ